MLNLFTQIKSNKNWFKEIYFLYVCHLLISLANFFLRLLFGLIFVDINQRQMIFIILDVKFLK